MSGVNHVRGPQGAVQDPAEKSPGKGTQAPGRDRYLDVLRALALVRVVAYHTYGWAVFTLLFPSMGIMFALAGSLMARSLQRPALEVLTSRTRRLLLPLWVYSATVLVLLFLHGWTPSQTGNGSWQQLFVWFLPLSDPFYPVTVGDGSGFLPETWAGPATGILWYIRAYFWFMLLSPLLHMAYRARPLLTLFAPLGSAVCLAPGILPLPAGTGATVSSFTTFGSCWLLGFAYQSGDLRRVPLRIVFTVAPALMCLGLWWVTFQPANAGWNINTVPLTQALWSFGFSAMLLRISPSWKVLPRPIRFLDPIVTLVNQRAMTIYLWHNLLLVVVVALRTPLYSMEVVKDKAPWLLSERWPVFVMVWVFLGIVVLAVGWVEDIAGKRPPRLWPDGSRPEKSHRRPPRKQSASEGWLWLYPRSFRDNARIFLEPDHTTPSNTASSPQLREASGRYTDGNNPALAGDAQDRRRAADEQAWILEPGRTSGW